MLADHYYFRFLSREHMMDNSFKNYFKHQKRKSILLGKRRIIEEVIDEIKEAKDHGRSSVVLMGAGMSVTAGIPAANGIMKDIEKKFPEKAKEAEKRSYTYYMSKLLKEQRDSLIREYVKEAKLNWAHIHLASLIKEGYINRVLTTNFDPFMVKALFLLNIYPAVYDFAVSQYMESEGVVDPAVFYLQGLYTGFFMEHGKEDKHAKRLGELFEDSGKGRLWIVIGYSGKNDPVINRLIEFEQFEQGLFWVGYKDNPPAERVKNRLLTKKNAFYISGYDADEFFRELASRVLGNLLPSYIDKPFTHLKDTLSLIAPYPPYPNLIGNPTFDLTEGKRKWIDAAIEGFEEGKDFNDINTAKREEIEKSKVIQAAMELSLDFEYDKLDGLKQQAERLDIPEVKKNLAYAYYRWGKHFDAGWVESTPPEMDFTKSVEKYEQAIELNPAYVKAHFDLGVIWWRQKNYDKAKEKFRKVIELKPDAAWTYVPLLEIFLSQDNLDGYQQTWDLYQKNCRSVTDESEFINNILKGLALLKAIRVGKDKKVDYENFIDFLSHNGWVLSVARDWGPDEILGFCGTDELYKFYNKLESRLDEKSLEKIKAIFLLWGWNVKDWGFGKSLDDFKKDVASWFPGD